MRGLLLPAAAGVAGALFLAWLGLKTMAFSDYEEEAEPALFALRDGDLAGFLDQLPAYGGSLVLRSPFALLPELWGGGDWALYRSMAAPCLMAGVVLGVFLWRRAEQFGLGRRAAWAALLLCAANPLTLRALEIGHPEELLGGVLCVGAALAAASRRPLLAGALLGLAVANKPWAVLAVVPVAILAPESRWRLLGVAGLVATAVLGPLALAGSAAVESAGEVARDAGEIFQPWQVWWFLGDHGQVVMGTYAEKPGYRAAPGWIGEVARPLVVLIPVALSLALARRLRARPWQDALLLLALVLLLRCLLDPWNVVYYELPFLLALTAWEVHARRGVPVVSLAATLLCWVTLEQLPQQISPDAQALAFLAWSVPFALALTLRLAAPERFDRVLRAIRLPAAGPPRAASPGAPRA
ncbi:MAG TPA: glycosyltransferase 87 family protein [Thermoleophilaceae bacterium]|nr:glycosyltransferase 87 family protein [Thermoleophilaceae bacterium]